MLTEEQIRQRFISFDSLRYSTDAFIDYRIPGCAPKRNYALIGPGVSQNPNQPVSLREKHGFQVGGVSMPAGTTNPPHMHFTAEVFVCTKGRWQMHWGFDPDPLKAEIGEGDIFTVPTWIYRGFQSLGPDDAFMFTALGRDDTGGILWGPWTLEAAREQGVHLTEDYRIIDEQIGQTWNETDKRLQPMTPQEIAALRKWTPEQMARRCVRFADLDWSADALLDSSLAGCGGQMAPVIGLGMSQDRNHLAPVQNAHGFSIEWLRLPSGGGVSRHKLTDKQVVVVYRGDVELQVDADTAPVTITARGAPSGWDSYAMPADAWRQYRNAGLQEAVMLVMTPGDHRKNLIWDDAVVQAAGGANRAVDANGYVAPKNFVDRSQR
ncbi:MAG: cupin domain-containing protein [Burkholderiaceae bacterium]